MILHKHITENPQLTRQNIYSGDVYTLAKTKGSESLVNKVLDLLCDEFSVSLEGLKNIQNEFDRDDMYQKISKVRQKILEDSFFIKSVKNILKEHHFNPEEYLLDYVRLCIVPYNSSTWPQTHSTFMCHRDTWYGNSESQINFWMPLHDVTHENSFHIYPTYFDKAILNNSSDFDYNDFMRKAGWGKNGNNNDAVYPQALNKSENVERYDISLKQGDVLLFAAHHLHQTINNMTGYPRFSIDFRVVHKEDHQNKIGAPNVDNHSTGSALVDYIDLGNVS